MIKRIPVVLTHPLHFCLEGGVRSPWIMLEEKELELVEQKLLGLEQRVAAHLDPGPMPGDSFAEILCEVVEQIASIAGSKLELVWDEVAAPKRHASLKVGNVSYLAVPKGPELEPFLDLLVLLSRASKEKLYEDEIAPAKIEVLIASACPNCPKVVTECARVACEHPKVHLSIIDVHYFADLAGSCRSVPTVVIDGARTIVGPVSSVELVDFLKDRSSGDYVLKSLVSMTETGRLAEAVPLLTSEPGMAALATLMEKGSMQDRMGLMLVADKALQENPHSLDRTLPYLLTILSAKDANVRGDVADLLGQIGAPGARDALSKLLSDENPDVREIAQESLDMLRKPS
ncbi:MAG: HEAT repeat domain-containing protein [Pseudomonadota bacterium]